jgi:hypothetical protein
MDMVSAARTRWFKVVWCELLVFARFSFSAAFSYVDFVDVFFVKILCV